MSNLTPYNNFSQFDGSKNEKIYPPSKLSQPAPGEKEYLCISGHFLPLSKARGHSLTVGMTRTGKTHLLQAAIAFAAIHLASSNGNLIDFDFKGNDYPFLKFFADKHETPLYYFNPADKRSWALDIAKDSGGYFTIMWEMAKLLVPDGKESSDNNRFFKLAVQSIIYACMVALTEQRDSDWGLHDVINLALLKAEELHIFFQNSPEALSISEKFLMSPSNEVVGNIGASLMAEIMQLMPIAANQYHTPKERWISMKEILSSPGILLVGHDSLTRESSNVFRQLIFRHLYNHISDLEDDTNRIIHIYIDELAAMGKIPHLDDFLATTASRGAMVNIASQSWGSLAEIYGENTLYNIVGNCEYINILRCDPQTANFAVNLFGKQKRIKQSLQFQRQDGLFSHSTSVEEVIEERYNTNDFTELPLASYETGIHSYFRSELKGIRRLMVPGDWVNKYSKPPMDKSIPVRIRKTQKELIMPRWNPELNTSNSDFAQQANSVADEGTQAFLEMIQKDV